VRIARAEVARGLSNDWIHSLLPSIIELDMSEAQWARFISTLNVGDGTPCTLDWIESVGLIPEIPFPPQRKKQFTNEMSAHLIEIIECAKQLSELIEKGGRKSEMRSLAHRIMEGLPNSTKFIADQFGEHVEKITEHAKVEIHAYLMRAVTRAGLKALGAPEEPPVKMLDEPKGET